MFSHVVTLTSVWLFVSICLRLWIHFHERRTVNQTFYSRCTALCADPACALLGREEKGIWEGEKQKSTYYFLIAGSCWDVVIWSSMLEVVIGYPPLWVLHVRLMLTNGSVQSRIEHCSCKRDESTCVRCWSLLAVLAIFLSQTKSLLTRSCAACILRSYHSVSGSSLISQCWGDDSDGVAVAVCLGWETAEGAFQRPWFWDQCKLHSCDDLLNFMFSAASY